MPLIIGWSNFVNGLANTCVHGHNFQMNYSVFDTKKIEEETGLAFDNSLGFAVSIQAKFDDEPNDPFVCINPQSFRTREEAEEAGRQAMHVLQETLEQVGITTISTN